MSVSIRQGGDRNEQSESLRKVYDSYAVGADDDAEVISVFEAGSSYLVKTAAWTDSTGVVYAHGLHLVTAPDVEKFGDAALTHSSLGGSTNGVSLTWNADSTLSWKPSSNSYRARIAVYLII